MHPDNHDGPVKVHVTYAAKKGHEDELRELVLGHWHCLRQQGLATAYHLPILEGEDGEGSVAFMEVFEWLSADASRSAHSNEAVMAIWGAMGPICERLDIRHISAEHGEV